MILYRLDRYASYNVPPRADAGCHYANDSDERSGSVIENTYARGAEEQAGITLYVDEWHPDLKALKYCTLSGSCRLGHW